MSYKKDPKFLNQIQYCEQHKIPLMIIVGAEEKEKDGVKIRDVCAQTEVYLYMLIMTYCYYSV